MIWFLILVPFSWFLVLHEAWTSQSRYDPISWPHSIVGWIGIGFALLLVSIVSGLIAGGIAGIVSFIASQMNIWNLKTCKTHELVSIRDKDGVHGSVSGGLFLFTGSIESRLFYFYYVRDDDGSIRPKRIQADDSVYIHEGGETAKLEVREWETDREWPWLFGMGHLKGELQDQYHFFVPTGTVRREMTM